MSIRFDAHDPERKVRYGFRESAHCIVATKQCRHIVAFYCGKFYVAASLDHKHDTNCELTAHRCALQLSKMIVDDYGDEFSAAMRANQ